jgi:sulfur carrier protein
MKLLVLIMQIIVNGKKYKIKENQNILMLLKKLGFKMSKVAVEINQDLIPRETYKSVILKKGDKVEIVTFLGGG